MVRTTKLEPTRRDYAEAAAVREALREFHSRSDVIARDNGLTGRMYQLLLMIKTPRDGSERVGLGELEQRLHLGKSTITELVLRAEKRGLVRRELDRERRRGIVVRLTPAGEQRLAGVLRDLGNERKRLVRALAKLTGS